MIDEVIGGSTCDFVYIISEHPLTVGALGKLMRQSETSGSDLIIGDHLIYDGRLYSLIKSQIHSHLWFQQTVNSYSLFFKRSFFEKNRLSTDFGELFLIDFVINNLEKIKYSVIDYPVSICTNSNLNMSKKVDLSYLKNYFSILSNNLTSKGVGFDNSQILEHLKFVLVDKYNQKKLTEAQKRWYAKVLKNSIKIISQRL